MPRDRMSGTAVGQFEDQGGRWLMFTDSSAISSNNRETEITNVLHSLL
jgi:hypothetical protein